MLNSNSHILYLAGLASTKTNEVKKMEVFVSEGPDGGVYPDACVCDCTCHPGQNDAVSIGNTVRYTSPTIPSC